TAHGRGLRNAVHGDRRRRDRARDPGILRRPRRAPVFVRRARHLLSIHRLLWPLRTQARAPLSRAPRSAAVPPDRFAFVSTRHDIVFLGARRLTALLRAREVSAVEVMSAFLARIERLNPAVNAIPTLRPRAELLAEASAADARLARGDTVG